ncbi:hypothetical protein SYNPS1DRAFT_31321 [Syncephalis pseudoplumigaleata]|uniref:Uncharacterized protein n=1 Tax=Syncephalis pseudoplumigaleata TaxID=1712513 RepID=A0A4P9YSX9_9FUNG|nr:hypothetical protein SYNPS1DRAFT_31321 [Syncephalis pseudoplumigaleata]|eukprot:RKP22987.1 hypothetical protein SYNPS1DRAFT_31321 [Syncephalis pseudoplumigaleata]
MSEPSQLGAQQPPPHALSLALLHPLSYLLLFYGYSARLRLVQLVSTRSTPPTMTIIRDTAPSNDSFTDHAKLFDSDDDNEHEAPIPLAVPLHAREIPPPSSTATADGDRLMITPPPKPPRGRSPVRQPTASSSSTSMVTAPMAPPPLPPRPAALTTFLPAAGPPSPGPLSAPLPTRSPVQGGLSLNDVRLVIRLMQAEGNVKQARALAQTLPVDPEDPNRSIDPEVDLFLGYRAVPYGSTGIDTYDFYEELGAGYYFYSTRDIAWDIGRRTDWTNFEVVRAYIKPPYRRGYEQREKIRVYPGAPQSQSSAVRRSNSFSLSRIMGALREEPKYHIASILQSSFNQEILIADAPTGHGMQIKLGLGLGAQIVRLNDEYNLDESGAPEGGWPIAVYEHTRTHGRLRTLVQRAASNASMSPGSSINA